MNELLPLLGVVVAFFFIVKVILPKLGING